MKTARRALGDLLALIGKSAWTLLWTAAAFVAFVWLLLQIPSLWD